MQKFLVSEKEANQTVEKFVRKALKDAPLSYIYKLFRKKDIKINGHWVDSKTIVSNGDEIAIYITDSQLKDFKTKKIYKSNDDLKQLIVFEDKNILIVNKPRGMLVQNDDKTVSKSLDKMVIEYLIFKKEYDPERDISFTPGPAHRLDRNTSGLVIFGKNIEVLQYLLTILKEKENISKRYLVLVNGVVEKDGFIEAPLKKNEETGKVHVASIKDGGKNAKTIYHVLKNFENQTLLEVILVTGRTHQIRVHMAYINHPVIGDRKYGDFDVNKDFNLQFNFTNQFLHAYKISFGDLMEPLKYLSKKEFECLLPEEENYILTQLK